MAYEEDIRLEDILSLRGQTTTRPAACALIWHPKKTARNLLLYLLFTFSRQKAIRTIFLIAFMAGIMPWTLQEASGQYPVVAGTANSFQSIPSLTHTISLPSGIQPGDLLMVMWTDSYNTGLSSIGIPIGWNYLYNVNYVFAYRRMVMYKLASGTEGPTITIYTNVLERSTHNSYRIAAGSYTGLPVSGTLFSLGVQSAYPNPPALTSGFGNVPTLWLATSHSTGDNNLFTPFPPTGFTDLITAYTGAAGNSHCRMTSARRELSAASVNPDTFALASPVYWGANTIAIRGCTDAVLTLTSAPGTDNQLVRFNNPITTITYSLTGSSTGVAFAGLPPGVTGIYAGGTLTISGTPTQRGVFAYNVSTIGNCQPCSDTSAYGTITVTDNLTISKILSTPVPEQPGDLMQYIITYANNNQGGQAAIDVEIKDFLPPDSLFTFLSASLAPTSNTGGVLTWNSSTVPSFSSLPPGTYTLTINGVCGSPGDPFWPLYDSTSYYIMTGGSPPSQVLSNNASISSSTATDPIFIPAPVAFEVEQFCQPYLQPDSVTGWIKSATPSTIYYIYTVTNNGNITDNFLLTIDPNIPPTNENLSFSIETMGGAPLSSTGWLQPGESLTFVVRVDCLTGTQPNHINYSMLIATSLVCGTSDQSMMTTHIYGGQIPGGDCDLQLAKAASANPMVVHGQYTYTLAVSNRLEPASDVAVVDYLPDGMEYDSSSYTTNVSGASVVLTYDPVDHELMGLWRDPPKHKLENTEFFNITIYVRPACSAPPMVENLAEVFTSSSDSNLINNSAALTTVVNSDIPSPSVSPAAPVICSGDSVVLTASGAPAGHAYKWYDNSGTLLSKSNPYTTPSLTASTTYFATIYEIADTLCESSPTQVIVTVFEDPVVIVDPVDAEVCENDTAWFSIEAAGSPPLSYKWQVDDGTGFTDALEGPLYTGTATNALQINGALPSMDGYLYRCLVQSGTCGFVTASAPALLTVYTMPVCSISGPDSTLCPASVHVYSGPESMTSYSWSIEGNGSIIGPANARDVTVVAGGACHDSFILLLAITDSHDCASDCKVEVFVSDDAPPELLCPPSDTVMADPGLPYATLSLEPLIYSDDCSPNDSIAISWAMEGATIASGDSLIPDPYLFNVGTTYITYYATDECENTDSCQLSITVLPNDPPVILCPPDTILFTDEGVCTAAFDPGTPNTVSGTPPFAWQWIMTGATVDSDTTNPIQPLPYTFNLGTTTITWIASNISGSDTCEQVVEVRDTVPPSFTVPPAYECCVMSILSAIYDGQPEPLADIIPEGWVAPAPTRPDSCIYAAGSTELNVSNILDNCCEEGEMILTWTITFSNGHPPVSGTGQPSAYDPDGNGEPDPIILYGNLDYTDAWHTIAYQLTDCNGNLSATVSQDIVVKPRPYVKKMNEP